MMKALLAVLLALSMAGCAWLGSQDFDICTEYKGHHVCVGRLNGRWTFSAVKESGEPVPLSPADEEAIKREVGR